MQSEVKYPEWQAKLREAQQKAEIERAHENAITEDRTRLLERNKAKVLCWVLRQLLEIDIPDLTENSYVLDDYRFRLGMYEVHDDQIKRFTLNLEWVFSDEVQAELIEYDVSSYTHDFLEHGWHRELEAERDMLARMLDQISKAAAATLVTLKSRKNRQPNQSTSIDFITNEEALTIALWDMLRPRIAVMLDERMGEF